MVDEAALTTLPRFADVIERAEIGARYGLPAVHVQRLAIEDALELGNLAEARKLYAELLQAQPRWRDATRVLATLPNFESFQALVDE